MCFVFIIYNLYVNLYRCPFILFNFVIDNIVNMACAVFVFTCVTEFYKEKYLS